MVNEGDDTSLECKARGHPKPRIAWWREDNKPFPVYDPANNHTKRQKGEQKNLFFYVNSIEVWRPG